MGVCWVVLADSTYDELDRAMLALGYSTTIPTFADSEERALCLPQGCYYAPDRTAERMRDDACACVAALGILGAQVVATDGASAWRGLLPVTWES